eukprot:1538471-Alexandrium_andersonii.AAC.1
MAPCWERASVAAAIAVLARDAADFLLAQWHGLFALLDMGRTPETLHDFVDATAGATGRDVAKLSWS